MLVDDAWARDIVAKFGSIADRVAHIAHATLVHQVYDEFHLVHALEVGYFRLIACLYKRLEACTDQRGDPATENRLLAKEVSFGLFGNSCVQHTGTRAADRTGICQGQGFGVACGILKDGPQGRNTYALGEEAAQHVARAFRRNHRDINVGRGYYLRVVQAEAVCCHQHLAWSESGSNVTLEYFAMMLVWDEDHDNIGLLSGGGPCHYLQSFGFGLLATLAVSR